MIKINHIYIYKHLSLILNIFVTKAYYLIKVKKLIQAKTFSRDSIYIEKYK